MRRKRPSPRDIDAMAREDQRLSDEASVELAAVPWYARMWRTNLQVTIEAHAYAAARLREANKLTARENLATSRAPASVGASSD